MQREEKIEDVGSYKPGEYDILLCLNIFYVTIQILYLPFYEDAFNKKICKYLTIHSNLNYKIIFKVKF